MKAYYGYDIARRDQTHRWQVVASGQGVSTRDPQSTARSVIERWINDHLGQLPGGQVFVFGRPKTTEPKGITASARVRIYSTHPPQGPPIQAVAYIGHHNRDDTTRPKTRRPQEWLAPRQRR